MAEIDRYRPEDRRQVEALYRRVFGPDAAEANRLRWDWQYRRNPQRPARRPADLARARRHRRSSASTRRCRCAVGRSGQEIDAAWGMDVMVAPERQRQGLGDVLFRTWDRNVGASLGLGLSESSYRLFQKMQWPDVGPGAVPRQAAEPARAAPAELAGGRQPVRVVRHAALDPAGGARRGRCRARCRSIRHFDESFTRLWERVRGRSSRSPCAATRRTSTGSTSRRRTCATSIAALERDGEAAGYAVYRHVQEPRGRVTLLVDFLADPGRRCRLLTLLRWVDREARAADSDKIRTFALHEASASCCGSPATTP